MIKITNEQKDKNFEPVRCYECKYFKRIGRINLKAIARGSGNCKSPKYDKVMKVNAVDYCDHGEK